MGSGRDYFIHIGGSAHILTVSGGSGHIYTGGFVTSLTVRLGNAVVSGHLNYGSVTGDANGRGSIYVRNTSDVSNLYVSSGVLIL